MPIVYIGIGSNLGDRRQNCLRALDYLKDSNLRIVRASSQYDTEPWGHTNQPRFINMVVEVSTDLSARDLLAALKKIEIMMGRTTTFKWGPRIIDLDILIYNDLNLNEEDLKIPHPHLHERKFVLQPLSEIAPELIHPVLLRKIRDLLGELAE